MKKVLVFLCSISLLTTGFIQINAEETELIEDLEVIENIEEIDDENHDEKM